MTSVTSPNPQHEILPCSSYQAMTNELRCGVCSKLLAKLGEVVGDLEIKCSRCKTINNTASSKAN